MEILVIATHPDLKNSRVNKVWLEALKKERNITVRFLDDIYNNKKNIDIELEKQFFSKAERVVFQFPFYWYSMPSLLREYFDKVLEYGWAYGPNGNALKGKEFLVALSVGAPQYSYTGGSYNNFTITELLRPLEATANAVQMEYLPYFALFDIPRLSDEKILNSVIEYIEHINNEKLNYRKVLEKLKKENSESSFIDL
ncbi:MULTISPECIES: NAD(P)H-dependent oxidoreductase [Cetobacterium]|uniref:NAD(P)H-dependent oxidoreductase n=1 Tax=Candidatus Cetobacterium colombiensis TaxID=3073100 RepID=A0ABU4W9E9_9FUSO|nr:NAD(P)H-dependent oxidoreductase [Candidatus Cetobacterium colombiensis]MDX8335123.1 NAD(P)H-dependent oxidoreductase [Candidatus Cetobacterium colombiensis]